jgi:hypothetical protein
MFVGLRGITMIDDTHQVQFLANQAKIDVRGDNVERGVTSLIEAVEHLAHAVKVLEDKVSSLS